jgi:hypothetical protein
MSLFKMWVLHDVAHKIVVNTFLVRRQHWEKNFGVYPLKNAKCMAWIFQEGYMWK